VPITMDKDIVKKIDEIWSSLAIDWLTKNPNLTIYNQI
jgi:hypothetical protein